jgi:NADP-dependent 3-hydroxy acid dehydrogenase YdfG
MPVAIITGASSGIGEAVVRELHSRGWKVGLIARRAERLQGLVDQLGDAAAHAVADVTDSAALTAAMAQLQQTLGPCDLMLANAGIGESHDGRKFNVEVATQVLNVNVIGVVNAVGAVLPGMLERGRGHIAVTSSVAGFRGLPRFGAYSASKAAVSTLFESLRVDLRGSGVVVTSINPGFVESELTENNTFSMPFLMGSDRAAKIIVDGLQRQKAIITFPWQMACLMGLVRLLPNWIYDATVGKASPTSPKRVTSGGDQ